MNQFDEMSEDLTSMMMTLDREPDQLRVGALLKTLERAHAEACKVSQGLRDDLARVARDRENLLKRATRTSLPILILGYTALQAVAEADFGVGLV